MPPGIARWLSSCAGRTGPVFIYFIAVFNLEPCRRTAEDNKPCPARPRQHMVLCTDVHSQVTTAGMRALSLCGALPPYLSWRDTYRSWLDLLTSWSSFWMFLANPPNNHDKYWRQMKYVVFVRKLSKQKVSKKKWVLRITDAFCCRYTIVIHFDRRILLLLRQSTDWSGQVVL